MRKLENKLVALDVVKMRAIFADDGSLCGITIHDKDGTEFILHGPVVRRWYLENL